MIWFTMARRDKVTEEQKIIMLDFMEEHEDFAKGKLSGTEGRTIWASLWEILCQQLNCTGGPTKSLTKWQRVWTDLKNKCRRKVKEINRSRRSGDPVTLLRQRMTDFENRLFHFLSKESVPDGPLFEPLVYNKVLDGISSTSFETKPLIHTSFELIDDSMSPESSIDDTSADTEVYLPSSKCGDQTKNHRIIAETAVHNFTQVGEELNATMKVILNKLDDLVEERKTTNQILQAICDKLPTYK